jgi:hypothetical protein
MKMSAKLPRAAAFSPGSVTTLGIFPALNFSQLIGCQFANDQILNIMAKIS